MARTSYIGFVLTLAGCPYLLTTGGLAGVTSSDGLWFGGESGVQTADGWLEWPAIAWTETANPLDGDYSADSLGLVVHDAMIDSGPAAGENLFSWLATRDPSTLPVAYLTASVDNLTTAWTVNDGSLFSAPCFAWIEGECVRVTAVAGNNLTVTRGVLGTRAAAHTLDSGQGAVCELHTGLPWTLGRKAVLWGVTSALVAQPLYLGVTGAPALDSDGARFAVNITPLWLSLRESPVGTARGVVELTGFNGQPNGGLGISIRVGNEVSGGECLRQRYTTFEAAAQSLVDRLTSVLDGLTIVTNDSTRGYFRRDSRGGVFHFDLQTTGTVTEFDGALGLPPVPGTPEGGQRVPATFATRTGTNQHAITFAAEYVPRVAYRLALASYSNTFGVRSTLAFDRFVTATAGAPPAGRTLKIQPGLKARLSDDWDVLFLDVTTFGASRYLIAKNQLVPRKPGLSRQLAAVDAQAWWIVDPDPLAVVAHVQAEHWADGLRYALVSQSLDTVDADWDWTGHERLIDATRGSGSGRNWTLDGSRNLGALIGEACLLTGCSVVTRAGKLALTCWKLPQATDTPALTLTSADLVGERQGWEVWREGLANSVALKSDALTLNVELTQSIRRYGKGRTIQVDLDGVEVERLRTLQPDELYRTLLSRVSLWAQPVSVTTVTVDIARVGECYLGDLVELTEWHAPDSRGGRGQSGERGLVVGRTVDLGAGTLTLRLLGFRRAAYGYAPCVKLRDSGVVTSTECKLERLFIQGTEDYAGSEAAGDSDGGRSYFVIGDAVRIIQRDTTTAFEEANTIAGFGTSGGIPTIQFGTALSAGLQADIALGKWFDVVLDTYSTATATAQGYAWIGDDGTRVIDSTTDPLQTIAP